MNKKKSRLFQNRVLTKGFFHFGRNRNMPFSFQPKPKLMQKFCLLLANTKTKMTLYVNVVFLAKELVNFYTKTFKELLLG